MYLKLGKKKESLKLLILDLVKDELVTLTKTQF